MIQLHCSNCDKLLRVPDGTSGRRCKCPQCMTPNVIPAADELDPIDDLLADIPVSAPSMPVAHSPNPFQSPTVQRQAGKRRAGRAISLSEVFSTTWQIYWQHFLQHAGIVFAVGLCLLPAILLAVFATLMAIYYVPWLSPVVALLIPAALWTAWCGLFAYFLTIARGHAAGLGEVFGAIPQVFPALVIMFLLALMVLVGFFMLVLPAFIALAVFGPAVLIAIDTESGVIDSLKESWAITEGNRITLVLLTIFVLIGAPTINTIPLMGLVTVPFGMLLFCVAYLRMTGEATAVD